MNGRQIVVVPSTVEFVLLTGGLARRRKGSIDNDAPDVQVRVQLRPDLLDGLSTASAPQIDSADSSTTNSTRSDIAGPTVFGPARCAVDEDDR